MKKNDEYEFVKIKVDQQNQQSKEKKQKNVELLKFNENIKQKNTKKKNFRYYF